MKNSNKKTLKRQLNDAWIKNQKHLKGNTIGVGGPVFDVNEIYAVMECMLELKLSQGEKTLQFEKCFAKYIDTRFGVAVNSGSSANLLALSTLLEAGDIQKGDEVILPAATFPTVSSPIYQLGLIPTYVDVSAKTFCIDPRQIKKALSPKTKVIIPVHTLGFACDMDEIMDISQSKGLFVIEDCCEAHGLEYKGKKVGSFGHMSTFSFFVAHNITTGEGGMVLTSISNYNNILRSLREFGRLINNNERFYSKGKLTEYDKRYIFTRLGYNFRMTDILASIGLEQLKKLDQFNRTRINNADFFDKMIDKFHSYVRYIDSNNHATYYSYPIYIKENTPFSRRELCEFLEANGIETRSMMAGCLPDQPGFIDLKHRIIGDLQISREIRDRVFFIGCHQGISNDELIYIQSVFELFFQGIK